MHNNAELAQDIIFAFTVYADGWDTVSHRLDTLYTVHYRLTTVVTAITAMWCYDYKCAAGRISRSLQLELEEASIWLDLWFNGSKTITGLFVATSTSSYVQLIDR